MVEMNKAVSLNRVDEHQYKLAVKLRGVHTTTAVYKIYF